MENSEETREILNKNLMFKLLNRQQYVKELLQTIASLEHDIKTDAKVKELNQRIGELTTYIDELEDSKSSLNQFVTKDEYTQLKQINSDLTNRNEQLITNNRNLKIDNNKLNQYIGSINDIILS